MSASEDKRLLPMLYFRVAKTELVMAVRRDFCLLNNRLV
jgi:hypothetical protein